MSFVLLTSNIWETNGTQSNSFPKTPILQFQPQGNHKSNFSVPNSDNSSKGIF